MPGQTVPDTPSAQEIERDVIDKKFIAAGHKPEVRTCTHANYNAKRDGRYCLDCGTVMWDCGD